MSCEIKTIAKIPELNQIQELFGFSQDENWLNAIYYSLSPSGEIFALGHGSKIIVLGAHWDKELQLNQYTITWKLDLENTNDIITSIICIPILGQSNNAQSSTEWTCIGIGLSTGSVLFYTDSGMELFAKQWHNESVQAIKAQSGKRLNEELYINYMSCVCVVQGSNLIQILKSVKNQLQKGATTGNKSSSNKIQKTTTKSDIASAIDSIAYRKWAYGGSKNPIINDTVVVGPQKSSTFDHLLATSIESGYYAKYRSAPPQNSLSLSVGVKPYIGFHYAKEGFVQPVLADVARAVAGKIKSSLLTWITGPPQPQQQQQQNEQNSNESTSQVTIPSEPMSLRFGICDIQRTGLSVWLAPDNQLAAVVDTLGRIILVDCIKGIALRVWKGYRDAQCAFIKINEKLRNDTKSATTSTTTTTTATSAAAVRQTSQQRNRRHALFLIIFAPRRSCLEIWCMQRGPKIAAFNASKFGQLIYNTHSLMGITTNTNTSNSLSTSINSQQPQNRHHHHHHHHQSAINKIKYNLMNNCIFFDPIDKSLKELNIPFHCALSETNSKTAKDLHLLRRIKLCLRNINIIQSNSNDNGDHGRDNDDDDENKQIINELELNCKSLQTDEIRIQCLEMLITHNKIKPIYLKIVLDIILEQINNNDDVVNVDDDNSVNKSRIINADDDDVDDDDIKSSNDITSFIQRKQLTQLAMNYKKLVEFYLYINNNNNNDNNDNVNNLKDDENKQLNDNNNNKNKDDDDDRGCSGGDDDNNEFKNIFTEQINLSVNELDNLQKLIDLSIYERQAQAIKNNAPKVTFQDNVINSFAEYLSIFDRTNTDIILNNNKSNQFSIVGYNLFNKFLEKNRPLNNFIKYSMASTIASDDLMKLLLHYWLNKPFLYTKIEDLIMDLTRFSLILQHICALANEKIKYDYNTICLWWQNVREVLLESTSALRSLLAAMMCRNYSNKFRQRENSNDSSANEDDIWEQVSHEAAQWSLLIGKLDDIAVLGAILSCSAKQQFDDKPTLMCLKYERPDTSLKAIINGGKGIVTELVVKWLSSCGIDPNYLLETNQICGETEMSTTTNVTAATATATTTTTTQSKGNDDVAAKVIINSKNSLFFQHLTLLRNHFPFSLQSGILLCQLTWEYLCYWSKNMSNLNYLNDGLKCLATINKSDYNLKHGLCCMIWNAHLKIPLESIKKLINKTGRLPKEKLCMQDVGLSDSLIPQFLEYCITFLDHFEMSKITNINSSINISSSSSSSISNNIDLRFENLLHDGPIPLSLLTLQQKPANLELLQPHKQLIEILFMISSLNIKHLKPIQNLFDQSTNELFFTDINQLKLIYKLTKPDDVLQKKRLAFLCIAITATMDLIREDLKSVYLTDHNDWMDRIFHIANIWDLDCIQLRKHQIIELYTHNWDSYAEELLEQIIDTQNLGNLLLKITGRRLKAYVRNSPTAYAQVVSVGPLIADYMDTLTGSNRNGDNDDDDDDRDASSNNMSLENLINLSSKTFKCLSNKDTTELRIAGQIYDACVTLKENFIIDSE